MFEEGELVRAILDMALVTDKLYHIHLSWAGIKLTMLVVIGIDCTGSLYPNTIYLQHWRPTHDN
jgi:hypothetical protein